MAPSSQAMTEENKSSTTRQRLQRPTKAKDAEKDVKLPQIEDKSSTTTGCAIYERYFFFFLKNQHFLVSKANLMSLVAHRFGRVEF